ncbi:unnamed protein product [Didymodactylos carnosus]|uniref:Uncharacterized protein n=1 Tax=Didymodactylos carnosus TaxID=1234261 RepID=A0A8S2DTS7_9BILA|nr:unnamed protein product [Didymodactylos carnosus]CAF3800729.1 unnamed protein product [Didymodactylos carnosus]
MDDKGIVDCIALYGIGSDIERDLDKNEGDSSSTTSKNRSSSLNGNDFTPQQPIVDIAIIDRTHGEGTPAGYDIVLKTQTNLSANLSHGGLRNHEMYICFRRGQDKPPITDIGVLFEGGEKVMENVSVIETTPHGYPANLCSSSFTKERTLITYRRSASNILCNTLAVTDICVIVESKGEVPPHSFNKINKNLNRSMLGSHIYLCYKKSVIYPKRIKYKPKLLFYYPTSQEYLDKTAMFCFPMGAYIEQWPKKVTTMAPTFSTFLFNSEKSKIYGACVSYYEQYISHQNLTKYELEKQLEYVNSDQQQLYVSSCIVLFSPYAFFDTFRRFLFIIYHLILTSNILTCMMPQEAHLREQYLFNRSSLLKQYLKHFFHDIPYPSPSAPRIFVQYEEPLLIMLPEENGLPQNGASFLDLLKNLGTDNTLTLFLYALLESKLLIHSLRSSVLTGVVEAVNSMLFPFQWQCPSIPLCPLALSGFLGAPLPFLIGIDSRYFDICEPPSDVICVDLDTNSIIGGNDEQKTWNVKMFPKKPYKLLRQSLEEIKKHLLHEYHQRLYELRSRLKSNRNDFEIRIQMLQMERTIENRIREVFLQFMCALLYGYNKHLNPIPGRPNELSTDASVRFQFDTFLHTRDSSYRQFYNYLLKTQMFIRFIEQCSGLSSALTSPSMNTINTNFYDNNYCLAFFDDCCAKIKQSIESNNMILSEQPRLLDINNSTAFLNDKTVLILPEFLEHNYLLTNGTSENHSSDTLETQRILSNQRSIIQTDIPPLNTSTLASRTALAPPISHQQQQQQAFSTPLKIMPNSPMVKRSKLERDKCQKLCGLYDYPVLAVKTFSFMKLTGIEWNAITYGAYNRAVYEGTWPRHDRWATLRNVVRAVWAFKNAHYLMNDKKHQRTRHHDTTSFDMSASDDSDGCSIDSVPLVNDNTNRIESNENLKENRSNRGGFSNTNTATVQDDTFTNVFSTSSHIISTLAGTIREITESPYFPKMSFKNRPSFDLYISSSDSKVSNSNNNQTRSQAGILMTSSPIEIGDLGMLSYRLSGRHIQQSLNSRLTHLRRSVSCITSMSPLKLKIVNSIQPIMMNDDDTTATNASMKWELASLQQAPTNDPLGLLNLSASQSPCRIISDTDRSSNSRTALQPVKLFAHETFQTTQNDIAQTKQSINSDLLATTTAMDDDVSLPLKIPTSITQLYAKLNQSGLSALYSPKSIKSIRSYAFGRLNDLKSSVRVMATTPSTSTGTLTTNTVSTTTTNISTSSQRSMPQSASLYTFKNNKEIYNNSCSSGKIRESLSSLLSQQNFNNTTAFSNCNDATNSNNCGDIISNNTSFTESNALHDEIKSLRIDPASVGIPVVENNDADNEIKIHVEISSCNRCSSCSQFLYDEEIMAAWSSDDSELHTVCAHCGVKIIPKLSIIVKDTRLSAANNVENNQMSSTQILENGSSLNSPNTPTNTTSIAEKVKESFRLRSSTPITVHYLSPLVLRKELENVLDSTDHNNILYQMDFMDKHPILFWNLIWFFNRIQVSSHLIYMLLYSRDEQQQNISIYNSKPEECVRIRCMWDSLISYDDIAEPLYKTWEHDGSDNSYTSMKNALITDEYITVTGNVRMMSYRVMQSIISCIENNDLYNPVRLFIKETSKSIRRRLRRRSMYREILFLASIALGREKLSYDAFDREYNIVFDRLTNKQLALINDYDKAPTLSAVMCRRLFSSLEL